MQDTAVSSMNRVQVRSPRR